MRVGHVVQRYLPGLLTGSEVYMQHISEGLNKRGHTVSVLTSNALDGYALTRPWGGNLSKLPFERVNGVYVLRFPINYHVQILSFVLNAFLAKVFPRSKHDITKLFASCPFMLGLYFHLAMNEDVYDLVHATAFPLVHTWLAAKSCQRSRTPFVVTPFFHPSLSTYYNPELISILRSANAVFACTDIERGILTNLGVAREKIRIVPMGIDVRELSNCSGERFRKKFSLEGKYVVLFAGLKVYNKGAVHVLRAVEEISKKTNNVVLVAIGFANREWSEEVERIGRRPFLIDLPYLSGEEKADVFDACNVLVMPSKSDAFGIVYLEAWYLGKPVIGAKSGGVPAVISDGLDGFLVKFGDVGDIISKIQILRDYPVLAEKLGNNGRKKVIANYTWSTIVDKVERMYDEIITSSKL